MGSRILICWDKAASRSEQNLSSIVSLLSPFLNGTRIDLLDVRQPWHGEAQDWCCEHLFEYIEVSAADEEADESLQLDGDPQGVKRVLEALEAHTWPGLRLKANQNGSSISNGTHVSAANASELPNSGETDLPLGSGTNGQNGIAAPAGSQSEQEVELENFEAMLGRLSDARHQFQGIPDDERRARAAAFAMQMMESLGLDDDDDLDVDDDSSIGN
ncbi:hypothetical protein WJX75_001640 [Coccomyxa subellipsoidea]|uniref:Uncharacterized protein n=1 Tax=Coccomyxa subellipsoidea TaxID=248742 RepID=A0ABR2YJ14_9CHLO